MRGEEHPHGRLRVFLGAAPGVGKTFAMLEAARERLRHGEPPLVGLVETHGRAETEALLEGLAVLPRATLEYRGVALHEFDLDAALAKRPSLVLVDELAHTNVPGSRHARRWQDVEELLRAGIDVWTTINVQHVESLNDVVAQITGVVVRETVPDSLLERADEVALVDLPPDELLERLRSGKVYAPELAGQALESFFRKGNLIALRELALRTAAERVDAQMEVWRRAEPGDKTWAATERILVSVSSSPSAVQLVRAGRRMAAALRATWIVAWVDTPRQRSLPAREREHAARALTLAETLGAEAVTLDGQDAAEELAAYARRRNVTRMLVGRPGRYWWRDRVTGSFVDRLARATETIDVTLVSTRPEAGPAHAAPAGGARRGRPRLTGWLGAVLSVLLASGVAWLFFGRLERANLVMPYLLAVVAVATVWGRGPASLAALLGVIVFDFFFVTPYFSLAVSDTQYVLTFGVMLTVGLTIGTLVARNRDQAEAARRRERETAALYSASRELAAAAGREALVAVAARHMTELFGRAIAVFLPLADGRLELVHGGQLAFAQQRDEHAVASWSFQHGMRAGRGTDTLPGARAVYVPLLTARGPIGTVGVGASADGEGLLPDQVHLVEALAGQLAIALERERLTEEAERSHLRAEEERLQAALLSSVSHDLRTPLATISGAASAIVQPDAVLDDAARHDLAQTIVEESGRLTHLVGNLLDMTKLSAGAVTVRREAHAMEELVGAALEHIGAERIAGRPLHLDVPGDLPLVPVDGVLIEQVLVNILDNALRYSPDGSPLDIVVRVSGREMWVIVADRGPGLAEGEKQFVFERFARGSAGASTTGSGLGLAICRGILDVHGGSISAANRPGGGAVFRIGLPLDAPEAAPEEADA